MSKKNSKWWWGKALSAFIRVSGWVATPIIIALFVGKWLDQRWGSEPWAFLGATAVAFAVSIYGIIKETQQYYRELENDRNDENTHGDNK